MAGHIVANFCGKPNRFTRRIGSVWQCNCGALWSLHKAGPYGTTRTWVKVKASLNEDKVDFAREK